MTQLNVLITRSLEDECLREIAGVSPEINLVDASELTAAETRGDFSSSEKFDAMLAEAEVMCWFWPPKNVIARAPKLKWAQSMLAGVDQTVYADIFKSKVILTNMRGIHGSHIFN